MLDELTDTYYYCSLLFVISVPVLLVPKDIQVRTVNLFQESNNRIRRMLPTIKQPYIMSKPYKKQDPVVRDVKPKDDEHESSKHDHNEKNTNNNNDAHERQERSTASRQRRPLATSTSLFVTGLAHAINKRHIEKLFKKFGTTKRISDFMTSQKSSFSSRYCFVEYESIENAQKAMDNLHGRSLLAKRLVILPAHANTDDNTRKPAAPLNPKKERILIDQKIAALKKKIKESQID